MTTYTREDYLIYILRITGGSQVAKTSEIASRLGISPASVSEMVRNLADEGMVEYEKYRGVSLTEKGFEYAKHLREKHQVMERFLVDVLDANEDVAHEEACRTEHVISDESAGRICKILGTNEHCGCDCSINCNMPEKSRTLDKAVIGRKYTISHLKGGNPDQIKKLISMGFVPSVEVKLIEKMKPDGPVVVLIGGIHLALEKNLASFVYTN